MHAVEFTTELSGGLALPIPADIAAQLPKSGTARVILLTNGQAEDEGWRLGAYEQFMRDDTPQDSIYDSCQ